MERYIGKYEAGERIDVADRWEHRSNYMKICYPPLERVKTMIELSAQYLP